MPDTNAVLQAFSESVSCIAGLTEETEAHLQINIS